MSDRDDALRRELGWTGPEESDYEPAPEESAVTAATPLPSRPPVDYLPPVSAPESALEAATTQELPDPPAAAAPSPSATGRGPIRRRSPAGRGLRPAARCSARRRDVPRPGQAVRAAPAVGSATEPATPRLAAGTWTTTAAGSGSGPGQTTGTTPVRRLAGPALRSGSARRTATGVLRRPDPGRRTGSQPARHPGPRLAPRRLQVDVRTRSTPVSPPRRSGRPNSRRASRWPCGATTRSA